MANPKNETTGITSTETTAVPAGITLDILQAAQAANAGSAAPKAAEKNRALWEQARREAHDTVSALCVRYCGCGCKSVTKATFLPGHDARLHSRLAEIRFQELLAGPAKVEAK
jgi:hypothetical protein